MTRPVRQDRSQQDRSEETSFGRILSRDTAMKVILLALDVLSGAAIMRDHPMEKLIRDA